MAFFGAQLALGVDIGDDMLRIVALRALGAGYEVTQVACQPLPEERDPEAMASILRTLLRGMRAQVACGIPASGCAVKTASLPPARAAELAHVVRFEAETQFPLPLEDLVWGYSLLPEASGRNYAVIAGTRRTQVDEQIAQFQQAGVAVTTVLPASLAAASALAHPNAPHLLVVAGARWSDLCLFEGDRLLGCRSVLAGAPGAEGWAARIAKEARPWMMGETPPQQVIALGVLLPKEADMLEQAIALPVRLGDPWQDVRDPHGVWPCMEGTPASYATAVGLAKAALRHPDAINLLPSTVTEAAQQRRTATRSLVALLLLSLALIPVTLYGLRQLRDQQQAYQQAARQVQQVLETMPAPPSASAARVEQIVTTLQQPENRPLELLRALSVGLPDTVTLTDMTYDRAKTVIVLKGHADSHATIAKAVQATAKMEGVEQATLDYANAVTEKQVKGYDFQITCLLPVSDDPTLATGRQGRGATRRSGMTAR